MDGHSRGSHGQWWVLGIVRRRLAFFHSGGDFRFRGLLGALLLVVQPLQFLHGHRTHGLSRDADGLAHVPHFAGRFHTMSLPLLPLLCALSCARGGPDQLP